MSRTAQPAAGPATATAARLWHRLATAWQALAAPLARALLSQRGLALGAALAVLLPLTAGSPGQGLWIALLLGLGVGFMGLPQALGWSDSALLRLGAVALGLGLVQTILISFTVTLDRASADAQRLAAAILAIAVVVLPYGLARAWPWAARLLGPLLVNAWAAVSVFAGAALLLLGFTWPEPAEATTTSQAPLTIAVSLLTWIAAFAANRLEADAGPRWAGRLLALRSGLVLWGAASLGWVVAVAVVPPLERAAAWAAFGTPLEGVAALAGVVAGVLLALAAALTVAVLPGALARAQLAGRVGVSAAGEAAWSVALVCGPLLWAGLGLGATLTGDGWAAGPVNFAREQAFAWAGPLAALAHALVRVLGGRPTARPGTPLVLVLPGATLSAPVLACAEATARGWARGPVTVLAPPGAALHVQGPHLRLARQAGLPPPLAHHATDALAWQRDLPDADQATVLPLRELYASPAAAAALLENLPPSARVLVLLHGELAPGWRGALRAAPAPHLLLAGHTGAAPDTLVATRLELDLAATPDRAGLVANVLRELAPPSAGERRLLVLHGRADEALAVNLATLLDGRIDGAGRRVVASTLLPSVDSMHLLAWPAATWATVWAFNLAALERREHHLPLVVAELLRAMVGRPRDQDAPRLELVVIEHGFTPGEAFVGPERWADAVVALQPAGAEAGTGRLYDASAYTATLPLPPPSAVPALLPAVAQALLDQAYPATPATAPVASAEASPETQADDAPDASPEASPKASHEAASAEASPDAPPEAEPEAAPETPGPAANDGGQTGPADIEPRDSAYGGPGASGHRPTPHPSSSRLDPTPESVRGPAPDTLDPPTDERWQAARVRVFISYGGHGDAGALASTLRDDLEAQLADARAVIHLAPEPGGGTSTPDWGATRERLENCTHFVLLASIGYWATDTKTEWELVSSLHRGGGPAQFCAFVGDPEACKTIPFHPGYRFLGPFDEHRRLASLAALPPFGRREEMRRIADRLSGEIFSGRRRPGRRRLVLLDHPRAYTEFALPLAHRLEAAGMDVDINASLLDDESRRLYLGAALVVLTGPALLDEGAPAVQEAHIALAHGLPVIPVRIAPAELPFVLRDAAAANARAPLQALPRDALERELDHITRAIADMVMGSRRLVA